MRSILTVGAAALAIATFSAPAFAQDSAAAPPASEPAAEAPPTASSPAGSDASATAATLAVGATVKDNTGAAIGQVTALKPDAASGKQVATIKMGTDTFAVETDKLAIADGSATINATQAELKGMLGKK